MRSHYRMQVRVLGRRTGETIVGSQVVWPGNASGFMFLDSPENLEVFSSDPANSVAGTGTQSVLLHLLDANWKASFQLDWPASITRAKIMWNFETPPPVIQCFLPFRI